MIINNYDIELFLAGCHLKEKKRVSASSMTHTKTKQISRSLVVVMGTQNLASLITTPSCKRFEESVTSSN